MVSAAAQPAATMVSTTGVTLLLDQNAAEINGRIYVPNSASLIKDGKVYTLQPTAV